MININDMNLLEFNNSFSKISEEDILLMISNGYLRTLNINIFYALFLRVNKDLKFEILKYEDLYDRVIECQKIKRGFFRMLRSGENSDVFFHIIESPFANKNSDVINKYLDSLSSDDYINIVSNYNIDGLFSNNIKFSDLQLFKCVVSKFNILQEDAIQLVNNYGIKILLILGKMKNENEMFLFTKLGRYISCLDDENNIILSDGFVINRELFNKLKCSQIKKLMDVIDEKKELNYEVKLEIVIKLYMLFGFDDARKVLNDKYTSLTDLALEKIINFQFRLERNSYRLNNQQKYYYFGIEDDIFNVLSNDNVQYIEDFTGTNNYLEFKEKFMNLYNNYLGDELKNYLNSVINEREKNQKLLTNYKINKRVNEAQKSYDYGKLDIYKLKGFLDNIDINYLDSFSDDELNVIRDMFLGNRKVNNDCLLRLIFCNESLGLSISSIVNHFDIIMKITSEKDLSYNSVIDLAEIVKLQLYNIPYDCKDINLNTIAKIASSKKYCVREDVDVVSETFELHRERKKKLYSSIPIVNGKTEKYKYFVADFDAQYLMGLGVDTDSCLRISGLGENLYRYLLTSPHGCVVVFEDEYKKRYYAPVVRSGNGVHINGIDPEIDPEDLEPLMEAVNDCFLKMIDSSLDDEKIEVGTMSDLHLKKGLGDYKQYELTEYLPLQGTFDTEYVYSDYNKHDITHFIITNRDYLENKYYIPKSEFYQKRTPVYQYNVNREYDFEKINVYLNLIAFSSISNSLDSNEVKESKMRNYVPYDCSQFLYIIGNKDWFIGIEKNLNVVAIVLHNDPRAMDEYYDGLANVKYIVDNLKEDEKYVRR